MFEQDQENNLIVFQVYALDVQYPWWPWILPSFLLVLIVFRTVAGQPQQTSFQGPGRLLLLIPGTTTLLRDIQFYTLTRLVGQLTERQLPLPDALTLAGCSVGNRDLDVACQLEAERVRRGQPAELPRGLWQPGELPPLLHACLSAPSGEIPISEQLHGVADHYRRRLAMNLAWMHHVVPSLLLLLLGGGIALCYSFVVMWPISQLYQSLSIW